VSPSSSCARACACAGFSVGASRGMCLRPAVIQVNTFVIANSVRCLIRVGFGVLVEPWKPIESQKYPGELLWSGQYKPKVRYVPFSRLGNQSRITQEAPRIECFAVFFLLHGCNLQSPNWSLVSLSLYSCTVKKFSLPSSARLDKAKKRGHNFSSPVVAAVGRQARSGDSSHSSFIPSLVEDAHTHTHTHYISSIYIYSSSLENV